MTNTTIKQFRYNGSMNTITEAVRIFRDRAHDYALDMNNNALKVDYDETYQGLVMFAEVVPDEDFAIDTKESN